MEKLLSTAELAEKLDVPIDTLYTWRKHRTGPRGIRVGRHIRYDMEDVRAWLDRQRDPQPA